ncbi:TAXI family TRAP transporter solute-binding subunit [Lacrimispora indolis]|uniref:TAXI family TRAP transporter solute-binding subunit n=1 Tax=Lacrimispora indolis TaxID=69825 RepID=UPI003567E35C
MKKKIVAIVYGIMIAALAVAFFQNREGHVAHKINNADGTYSGSLTLGTASSTGTFYYVGAAIGNAVSKVVPINVNVQATSGSNENISMTLNHDIDLGMANCDSIYSAYHGTMSYKDAGPQEDLREVASLYQSQLHIFTTESSGITDISQLKGKKVCIGSQGTSYLFINQKILNDYGITIDDIHPYYMNYSESAEALANGDIDAAFQTGGYPIAGIQQSAATTEFRMLPISENVIQGIIDEFPFINETTIPADVYEHQSNESEVKTLGYSTTIFCSKDADEDLIYSFAKGMLESLDTYQNTNDATRQITPETIATPHIPIHEGALRYYREIGVAKEGGE